MADNTLRVSTEMDVGPLVAGTTTSAAALENLSAKFRDIAVQAELAGNSLMASVANLQAEGKTAAESAAAMVAWGASETEAATATAAVASAAGIAAPALQTVAKAAVGAGEGLQRLKAAGSGAGGGLEASAMAGAKVREELGAVTGSIGGIEYGLARVASRIPGLIPLINEAFPILLVAGFVEIIGHVYEAFVNASNAVMGYTKAVQDAEKEDIKWSDANLSKAADVIQAQEKLHSIIVEQGKAAQESFGDKFNKALTEAYQTSKTVQELKLTPLAGPVAVFEALYHAAHDSGAELEKLKTHADDLTGSSMPKLTTELEKQEVAYIDLKEAADKAGLPEGGQARVTAMQIELDALKQKAVIEAKIASDESEAKGGDKATAQRAAAEATQEYNLRILALTKELTEAQRKAAEEEIVEGDKILTFQTDMAKRQEEMAAQEKSRIAEEQIERERAADKDAADALKVVTARVDAQIEMAVESAKAAETAGLANIAAQEKDLAFTKQMGSLKLESTMVTGLAKISLTGELEAQELEQQKKLEDEKLRIIMESLEKQRHALTGAAPGSTAENQFLLVNPEAQKQFQEIMNKEAQAVQERNNKIKILDQQLELNEQQVANKMAEAFVKAFAQINQAASRLVGEMLTSNQKISVDFAKTGQQMLVSMAQSLAQQLLKKAETEAAIHIIEQSSVLQSIATFLSGNAAKQVAAHTMAESIIAMDAGMAAAGAFADAFIATPLPVALAAAPAAAAAAASGTEAAGAAAAFQKGGLTTEAGPAMLHAKEMVLPESISTGLQTMIARGGVGGVTQNSRRQNIEVHIHGGTNMTHSDIIKAVKVGIRRGELPVPG